MKVILGVTGCIGAYKAALVLRRLQEEGLEVIPVMTRSAQRFLTPLTLEKLSGHRVLGDLFDDPSPRIEHIALARESGLLLVAPATANILAKFARGIADDFLSTLYLSTTTPVVVAPAMNVEMWHHPATQENLAILRGRGVLVVEPEEGYLACGEVGEGRLADSEVILEACLQALRQDTRLARRQVLVTAGPTLEDIDPVRFLSNRSSGKMGYAVAREARRRGARVVLVSGPTQLPPPPGVEIVRVRSAAEMAQAVLARFPQAEVVVMAAAVSDFTPTQVNPRKIKKRGEGWSLRLTPTQDILQELGRRKNGQILVGFAAESERLKEEARRKLQSKNLDLVVANDISEGKVFQQEESQVVLLDAAGGEEELPLLSKQEVAARLWDRVEALLEAQGSPAPSL